MNQQRDWKTECLDGFEDLHWRKTRKKNHINIKLICTAFSSQATSHSQASAVTMAFFYHKTIS